MNKNIIDKIQKRIIHLLPADHKDKQGILLNDSCSEVSRLVAYWIKNTDETNGVFILKGIDVCGTQKAHDIIEVVTPTNKVYIIDPTIWQFFPKKKSILIFVSDFNTSVFDKIKAIYSGQWSKNEEIKTIDTKEEKNYLDVIYKNIQENLKQI